MSAASSSLVIPDLFRLVIPDLFRLVIPDLFRLVIPDLFRDQAAFVLAEASLAPAQGRGDKFVRAAT